MAVVAGFAHGEDDFLERRGAGQHLAADIARGGMDDSRQRERAGEETERVRRHALVC